MTCTAETHSDGLLNQDWMPCETGEQTSKDLPTLKIRPCKGLLAILAIHESRFQRSSGLFLPHTELRHPRWLGYVIGVGKGLSHFEFGEAVELSQWTGEQWFNFPYYSIQGKVGSTQQYLIREWDGPWAVLANGIDKWVFAKPEHIIYKIANRNDVIHGKSSIQPVWDRVFVRHAKRPDQTKSGIQDSKWLRWREPYCQVVDVGEQVMELVPGDWVFVSDDVGTHINMIDGEYSILREKDVLARHIHDDVEGRD